MGKLFHMKDKTFLEVGPRPQNKHSQQNKNTIIINSKSEVYFLLLLTYTKNVFKTLNAKQDSLLLTLLLLEETDRDETGLKCGLI